MCRQELSLTAGLADGFRESQSFASIAEKLMIRIRCGCWLLGLGVLFNAFSSRVVTTRVGASERPNVLLIVSEDNGPGLGCYGDSYARTPNLDRLASEGVRFENAFVPYSVCSPSRAVFLTGLYPHQNGQIGLATHKFAMYEDDTPNVVAWLKAAGYRTGLIGKLHVNPENADSPPSDA